MPSLHATLGVHRLCLPVRLGYGEAERATPQPVEFEIEIHFPALPAAAETDSLPFFCYDKLARALSAFTEKKQFKLIEHLAHQVFQQIRYNMEMQLGEGSAANSLRLTARKALPMHTSILGGASFTLSDVTNGMVEHDKR